MPTSDHAEARRLTLQIQRDLVVQAHLRTLLTNSETAVADHRLELRIVASRIKRTRRVGQ
jgi:hypothetical protein